MKSHANCMKHTSRKDVPIQVNIGNLGDIFKISMRHTGPSIIADLIIIIIIIILELRSTERAEPTFSQRLLLYSKNEWIRRQ